MTKAQGWLLMGSEWGTREAEDLYRSLVKEGWDTEAVKKEIDLIAGDNRVTVEMVSTAMKNVLLRKIIRHRNAKPYPETPMLGWPPLETLANWLQDRTGTPRRHKPQRTPHVVLHVQRPGGSFVGCQWCQTTSSFVTLDELPDRNAPEYPAAILAVLEEFESKHRECKG